MLWRGRKGLSKPVEDLSKTLLCARSRATHEFTPQKQCWPCAKVCNLARPIAFVPPLQQAYV